MEFKFGLCLLIGVFLRGANSNVVQTLDNSNQTNYLTVNKNGGHSTGVEVNTVAKPFSHYVESADGVRLGCYGYELFGKKFSTVYVSDTKGYRIIPSFATFVPVYPRTGEVRNASFESVFDADDKFSENIRHVFPDICRGSDKPIAPPTAPPTQRPTLPPTIVTRFVEPTPSPTFPRTPAPTLPPTPAPTLPPTPAPTLPPAPCNTCNKGVSLLFSGLVTNCVTLAVNVPLGSITQADLNKLNDIEVLNKVISILNNGSY